MTEYYDHFQADEPIADINGAYMAVYAAHQLPDGTWHCLLTASQMKALADKYKPYTTAPAKCKGQGVDAETKVGFPAGAPVHVYGDRVREPDRYYRPGSKDAVEVDDPKPTGETVDKP